ncbi:hypothetical protein, partial [Klebsiella pneumoniae]|uniref:hypothetical protein n=1 Tax=Klebsiella pneumoniae TaxID=573 RepID=UPI001D0DD163
RRTNKSIWNRLYWKRCNTTIWRNDTRCLRKAIFGKTNDTIEYKSELVTPRPPSFCAGCPHRGFFYELGKRKNLIVGGDIG